MIPANCALHDTKRATRIALWRLRSGPHGDWAQEVIASGSLRAPELARAEAANGFRRLEREAITTAEANAVQDDFMQLDIELFPFEPLADRVWELSHDVPCKFLTAGF